MKNTIIRIDNRESAILTAELTYMGYQVENVFLDAGDFEGKTIMGEIKRDTDFYRSIVDQRIYYQPHWAFANGYSRLVPILLPFISSKDHYGQKTFMRHKELEMWNVTIVLCRSSGSRSRKKSMNSSFYKV